MDRQLERALEHLMNECCRNCKNNNCEKGNKNCPLFLDYSKIRDAIENYSKLEEALKEELE